MRNTPQLEYKLAANQLFIQCELWQARNLSSGVTGKSQELDSLKRAIPRRARSAGLTERG